MKRRLFLLSIMLFTLSLNAQEYKWATGYYGYQDEQGRGITNSQNGDIYSCGYFTSDVFTAGNQSLNRNSEIRDIYIAKCDANGETLWLDNPGGTEAQEAHFIITDTEDNVYVTGVFQSDFTFGQMQFDAMANTDAFLIKYSNTGAKIWAKRLGSDGNMFARDLAIDADGNIYASGWFQWGDLYIEDTVLINNGGSDFYLAKFSPDGELIWAKSYGGFDNDYVLDVSIDHSGFIYLCGGFESNELVFGDDTLRNHGSTKKATFIVKLDADGTAYWADSHDQGFDQQFDEVRFDQNDNIYLAGHFKNIFAFAGDTVYTDGSQYDLILLKYNSLNQEQWMRHFSSSGGDRPSGMELDEYGNIYYGATFEGGLSIGDTIIPCAGYLDFMISKLDSVGELVWIRSSGGEGADDCRNMALIGPDKIGLTGFFTSPSISLGEFTLNNNGMSDAFIGLMDTDTQIGADEITTIEHINFYPNPFRDQITLNKTVWRIELFDLKGQLLFTAGNTNNIDIKRELPAAIYILRVTNESSAQPNTYKVVKR